ncbi:MAG: PQQ-binding-like beta-propeller repeat protein [Candidatus Eremiobacteraeota bacterium]|nr:PQQ-binding-like beta-propeller repeat protein [Candidatus Eremiobacteraeota bacterium]
MKDTCENCGKKVDRDFKFCPFCFHDFAGKDDELSEIDNIESLDEEEAKAAEHREESGEGEEEPSPEEDQEEGEGPLVAKRFHIIEPLYSSPHGTVCMVTDRRNPGSLFVLRDFILRDRDPSQSLKEGLTELSERFSALSHPNMNPLLEYFIEDEYLYLIFTWADAKLIEKIIQDFLIIKGEHIPESQIIRWAYDLSDLLSHLHSQEPEPVYCGNLKPYSLVVKKDDFSIIYVHLGLPYFYRMLGIPDQFEPEATGKINERLSSPLDDLCSLGECLYYLATGIDLTGGEPYVPLHIKRNDLSEEFSQIIEQLLNMRKVPFYQTAEEVKADLERLLPSEEPSAASDEEEAEGRESGFAWRHFLGNKRRTNSFGRGPSPPLAIKWSTAVPPSSQYFLTPCEDELLPLSDKGILCSLDYGTGRVIRKENLNINPVAPIIIDTSLYICSSSTQLAVKLPELSKRWEFRTKSMVLSSPNYVNDAICSISYDGFLMFINPDDGKPISMENVNAKVISTCVFDDANIYIPTLTGSMVAITIEDRTIAWQQNTKASITAAPSMYGGVIFSGNTKGNLFAFNAEDGEILWESILKGSISQSPRVIGDLVIAASTGGDIAAFQRGDGTPVWSVTFKPGFESLFTVTDEHVYAVNPEHSVLTIEVATGAVLNSCYLGEKINCVPLVYNDSLYVSLSSGKILALVKGG